ncbi:MAG TPA: dihydrofolate reductase family protein [Solirubrobacterales bacterium]|nr:dihydrofolate reductase family protein [Solirubrobacterales bacterium]
MSSSVLYMSMSLDGFVAGPNEGPGNGLGDGGMRLHEWFFEGEPTEHGGVPGRPGGVNGEVMDELMATGAVVSGRTTFELAGGWGGDHHDGVPVFIVSRGELGPEVADWPLVTFVDDVATAIARAKEGAGDRDVLVHGVTIAHLALAAGVLDELQIHLVPVLLGGGRHLFEQPLAELPELELTRVRDGRGVTHLRYRVHR